MRDTASVELGAEPASESPHYTAFLWERAEVYEAIGGADGPPRAQQIYMRLAPYADVYGRLAKQRLQNTVNDLCRAMRSAPLSEVSAAISRLDPSSSCVAEGYLRLADESRDINVRTQNYAAAVRALGEGASVAALRGRARMSWADLLSPGDSNATSLRRQAVNDYEVAKSSSGGDRAAIRLAYANARASLSTTFEPGVDAAFVDAVSAAGTNQAKAYALTAHAGYRRRTGQSTREQDAALQNLGGLGADPALMVRLAESELADRGRLSNRDALKGVADNLANVAGDRALAYYLLAADGLKNDLSASSARDAADKARPLGGDGSLRFLAMACLAHIKDDLTPDARGDVRRDGPQPLCGGSTAEGRLLEGLYRLALVRFIPPNTREGAAQISSARVAFAEGLLSPTGLDQAPTFALLTSGLTVRDLLNFGRAQSEACLGPDASSGLDAAKRDVARRFFLSFRATCN